MEIHARLCPYLFRRKILRGYLLALVLSSSLVFSSSLSISESIPINPVGNKSLKVTVLPTAGTSNGVKILNLETNKLLAIGNVVFCQGEIFSCDNLKVVNEKNVEIPSEVSNIVLWPDKSIMLATIMFIAETNKFYFINYGNEILRTNKLKDDDVKELTKTNFIINDIENRGVSVVVDVVKTANLKYYFYVFSIVFILTVLILRKISLRK